MSHKTKCIDDQEGLSYSTKAVEDDQGAFDVAVYRDESVVSEVRVLSMGEVQLEKVGESNQ